MKNFLPSVGLISFLIFTISQSIQAQDAPVTMIGYMVSCPSEQALVPVTVINCPAITSFSLHMEYDPRVMVFIDAVNINGSLAGMEFHDNHVSESVHKIMFTWVNFIPQYFYPENKLFDLHFTCLSGTSSILFNNTVNNGIECEYTDAAGNPLNDVPTASFYIDGQVSSYLVGPAGEITGKDSVCPGETGIGYTVTPVSFASGYVWTLPPGATITAGNNTNSVLVDFSTAASSGAMRVYGTSECGSGTYSPDFLITVNPLPTPTISADPPIPNEGTQVGQITEFSTEADMFEYEWTIDPGLAMVLSGDNTNILTVQWIAPGTCPVTVNYTNEQDCRPVSPVTTEVFIRLLKYVISGNVNYNNSILTPVDSVKLYLSRNAAIVDSTTTDDAGHYEFLPQSDGDYNVNGVSLKPWAGVNGTDVCQLRRYIAWLQPNSLNEPIRILAGDVNNDGWINGSDVIGLTRKIIGLSSSLSRLWIFSKPTIGGNTITVNGSNLNQNLFGLCTGDVNGSLGANISPTSDAPVVKIGSYCSSPGESIIIPLTISTSVPNGISSISFRIEYDPNILTYTAASNIISDMTMSINDNHISGNLHNIMVIMSSWYPILLPSGTKLFDLGFSYHSGATDLIFNNTANEGIECEFADDQGTPMNDEPTALYFINGQVTPRLGIPDQILGESSVCRGSIGKIFSCEPVAGATAFTWIFPSGATIVGGLNTFTVTVDFSNVAVSGPVEVYANNSFCQSGPQTVPFYLTMKSPPITQETITGSASVCQEQTGVSFSIPSIPSATGYGWTLPPGATITSGFNTNNILVDFSSVASSGLVTVAGTNECGSGIPSAGFHVTVNAPVPSLLELPTTVVLSGESPVYKARQTITAGGNGLTFTIQQGGNVQMVAGYNTRLLSGVFVHSGGNLLAKITNVPDPCVIQQQPLVARTNGSDESTASPEKELGMFKIYPNPNNGKFILELNPESGPSEVSVSIYGIMGETIMQRELNATKYHEFSLEDKPTGIYIIRVIQGERTETRKTIKN